MAELRHVPPGRSGRIWLDQRLHAGRRAADLLDRKLKVLRAELDRVERQRDDADQWWREAWQRADTWGLRATMASGLRELRLAVPSTMVHVRVTWDIVMGLRYPAETEIDAPPVSPTDRGPGGAALVEATAAYQEALRAAAALGAANAAWQVIEAEIVQTRRRLRAITDRWIPRLESRLSRLRQELDETEREENFRRRRAASRASQ